MAYIPHDYAGSWCHRCVWSVLIYVALLVGCGASRIQVETTHGVVRGIRKGNSDVFWGVPYAAPPLGPLRWKSPQPLKPWRPNVLDATAKPPGCIQICNDISFTCPNETAEDCLHLNIFRPSAPKTNGLLPVMVYLHGGNFRSGSCSGEVYDSSILAPTIDAVVVCIEYRLGAMGFLYLEADDETGEDILGNFGIEDQIAALKFIHQNLERFGGDPSRITLAGQSAGAESITIHLTSSTTSDLFEQVILFSDPFSLPLKSPYDSNALGVQFASSLGCEANDRPACLRSKSAEDIAVASMEALSLLINEQKAFQLFQQWGPTVTEQPIQQIQADVNALKPTMLGVMSEEGRIFVYELFSTPVSYEFYELYEKLLIPGVSGEILDLYPGYRNRSDQRDVLSDMITYYVFDCPTQYLARRLVERGETRVYHYLFQRSFSFDSVWQRYKWCHGYPCHGGDLPFIFISVALTDSFHFTEEEKEFSEKYSTYLANFVHNGDPNLAVDEKNAVVELTPWPKAGLVPGHLATLVFPPVGEGHIRPSMDLKSDKCQFFDQIGYAGVANINKKSLIS